MCGYLNEDYDKNFNELRSYSFEFSLMNFTFNYKIIMAFVILYSLNIYIYQTYIYIYIYIYIIHICIYIYVLICIFIYENVTIQSEISTEQREISNLLSGNIFTRHSFHFFIHFRNLENKNQYRKYS